MKKVSIIIVTHNSEKDIYDCVKSIISYADISLDEIELIIVDNNSMNCHDMFENLKELWGRDIVLLKNARNGGYGQGNNIGIRHSNAPIILIMNPDVRLHEGIFSKALLKFSNNEKMVMLGMTQMNLNKQIGRSTAWTNRIHPYIAEPLRYLTGRLNMYIEKYMYICGACFFVKKSTMFQIGLFDENIFMYCEEDDIHSRIKKLKNAHICYLRSLSYLHLHPIVTNYETYSHTWLEQSLESLIYMNKRDGIDIRKTVEWAIKRNDISIWKEKIKLFLGVGDKARYQYYRKWKDIIMHNYLILN